MISGKGSGMPMEAALYPLGGGISNPLIEERTLSRPHPPEGGILSFLLRKPKTFRQNQLSDESCWKGKQALSAIEIFMNSSINNQ